MGLVLMLVGGAVCIVWGGAHLVPTRKVVAGFGELSTDNRRLLAMEWIAEGLTLCFVGAFVVVGNRGAHAPSADARLSVGEARCGSAHLGRCLLARVHVLAHGKDRLGDALVVGLVAQPQGERVLAGLECAQAQREALAGAIEHTIVGKQRPGIARIE